MRPRQPDPQEPDDLFRARLSQQIDRRHALARLAGLIDWGVFETRFGPLDHPHVGRPGIPIRLMVGLSYLQHTFGLSDEEVVARWVENPYWQYFCGFDYFEVQTRANTSANLQASENTYFGLEVVEQSEMFPALVRMSANQTIPASTQTVVGWGSEVHDDAGYWDAGSPSRLTVPAGGDVAILTAYAAFTDNDTGDRWIEALEQFNRDTRLLVLDQDFRPGPAPQLTQIGTRSERHRGGGPWSSGLHSPRATSFSWSTCRTTSARAARSPSSGATRSWA